MIMLKYLTDTNNVIKFEEEEELVKEPKSRTNRGGIHYYLSSLVNLYFKKLLSTVVPTRTKKKQDNISTHINRVCCSLYLNTLWVHDNSGWWNKLHIYQNDAF